MKNINRIYSKNWDYSLYEIDDKKVITVMFFASFVDYPRSFYLKGDELKLDFESLSVLSEKIRFNYSEYENREIVPPIVD